MLLTELIAPHVIQTGLVPLLLPICNDDDKQFLTTVYDNSSAIYARLFDLQCNDLMRILKDMRQNSQQNSDA